MTLMGNADSTGDVPKRERKTKSFSSSLTSCRSLACCSCADGAFALPFGGFVALGCLRMEIVVGLRSVEHTSELQSLMPREKAVVCWKLLYVIVVFFLFSC